MNKNKEVPQDLVPLATLLDTQLCPISFEQENLIKDRFIDKETAESYKKEIERKIKNKINS